MSNDEASKKYDQPFVNTRVGSSARPCERNENQLGGRQNKTRLNVRPHLQKHQPPKIRSNREAAQSSKELYGCSEQQNRYNRKQNRFPICQGANVCPSADPARPAVVFITRSQSKVQSNANHAVCVLHYFHFCLRFTPDWCSFRGINWGTLP